MKNKEILNKLSEDVIKTLKNIYDPEIPVDIYELGLIYDIQISDKNDIKVIMTLTTPNCPVVEILPKEVEDKLKELENVRNVEVEVTFSPPWDKEMMSEVAKLELGFL